MTLKLVSVNIERDEHLDLVEAFLKKEQPDVVCLQEVFKRDFLKFQEMFAMTGVFANQGNYCLDAQKGCLGLGVAILSKLPIERMQRTYYIGDEQTVEQVKITRKEDVQKYYDVLVWGTIQKENTEFVIGTTHFPWTPDGQADDVQRERLQILLKILKEIPEIVLCGDFNAPRGREIFTVLSEHYTDNIPQKYITSIDKNRHRAGDLQLMVDGLFSTSHYVVSNVRLQEGVSDHFAIIGEVQKK